LQIFLILEIILSGNFSKHFSTISFKQLTEKEELWVDNLKSHVLSKGHEKNIPEDKINQYNELVKIYDSKRN